MFKEKETLLQNMAFMAIIAAIDVVAAILSAFFPIAGIFIMIFLPFFSAVVTLLCKWRYYPIYALAAIGVSMIATAWNMSYTVFYLLPSLITGFLFGLCFKSRLHPIYALLTTSIIQCSLTFAFIPLINFIYEVDTISYFLELFNLTNQRIMVLPMVYIISLIQMVFSYIVLINELKKFRYDEDNHYEKALTYIGLGLTLLVIPFCFFAVNFAYLLMLIALFISIYEIVEFVMNKKIVLIIISGVGLLLGIVLVFSLYAVVLMPYTLLLFNTTNIVIFITLLIYNLSRKQVC